MKSKRMLTACLLLLFLCVSPAAFSQTVVLHPVGHDVSVPLRDIPVIPQQFDNFNLHHPKPVPSFPSVGPDGALQSSPSITSAN
ncbi:MAG TPA: hypothetical protein VFI72_15080, partial [Candidatus Angelobacter sp.]|nr:hypothetical protein [Candidatus Angelobacter sp.]